MPKVISPPRGLTEATPFPVDCAERFEPVRCLAAGGFGMVYEAVQKDLGRRVAIKLLLADILQDTEQVRRFKNEALVTATLEHPHVVRVLDHGAATGVPWIAYEFVGGPSLRRQLEENPEGLELRAVIEIIRQVGSALDAAHAVGILHRDIKPDNVLEAAPGHQKLTDFGIAKWASSRGVHTQTGLLLGTPAYMAPELVTGAPLAPASDHYALGVMLHEMLVGRRPFEDENPLRLLEKHRLVPVPRVTALRADLPSGIEAVVQRALAKSSADRWSCARDLTTALEQCLEDRGASSTRAIEAPPGASARRSNDRPVTTRMRVEVPSRMPGRSRAVLALCLSVLALASLLFLRQGPEPVPPAPSPLPSKAPSPGEGPADTIGRSPTLQELEALATLHRRVRAFGLEVRKVSGSVAELFIANPPDLGKIWSKGVQLLSDGVRLLETAQRTGWTGPEWLYLDEIVADCLGALGHSKISPAMDERLRKLLERLERCTRRPPQGPHEGLALRALGAQKIHVTYISRQSFGGPVRELIEVERQVARLADAPWRVIEARLHLMEEIALFTERATRDLSDTLEERRLDTAILSQERTLARKKLALARWAVMNITDPARPPVRREALLSRILTIAEDHASRYRDQPGAVLRALDLARRAWPHIEEEGRSIARNRGLVRALASRARDLGVEPPCGPAPEGSKPR